MVRAHLKQTPEEKKETQKKKTPTKKKPVETGSWPCKINGCNKVFAREADLKRHQRTTKLHSMPAFACPQCDATFTRTDALRRHQKSRHNGVVIEPPGSSKGRAEDGEACSTRSRSSSRSSTPAKSADKPSSTKSTPSTAQAQSATSGPSSYYRQHTMHAGYPPARPPPGGMMIEPHYPPPVGIPTSAARLHQANWHPPPPWGQEGAPLQPSGIYHIPPYYQASPYYRPGGMMPPMPPPHGHPIPHQLHPEVMAQHPSLPSQNGVHHPSSTLPPQSGPTGGEPASPISAVSSSADSIGMHPDIRDEAGTTDGATQGPSATPVIDPSLSQSNDPAPSKSPKPNLIKEETSGSSSIEMARAAVQALIQYEKEKKAIKATSAPAMESNLEASEPPDGIQRVSPQQDENAQPNVIPKASESEASQAPPDPETSIGLDADAEGDADEELEVEGRDEGSTEVVGVESSNKAAADQLLPDDDVPMLHPAEILTQESLASPPPPS